MSKISELIRVARLKKGLSQENLGAILEITQQGYSKIERQPEKAQFDVIIKVAKIVEIDLNNLQQN